ncbi:MAG: Multidrug resistance protein MdtC [Alphaproteobacteria bacterium MarineAlpha6_Bin6]|nr:acriflavin resistance protein [Pelagibacteraceae bacterium]PPR31649.1 MAG: Multidrug resistance protein MdtC [Alphaproteobacteria bacterium MarineAlpha6_Bin6]PPR33203.1 MAG: Multidrug resistance protein MdtC [Alphaproteobacteria bacterium MarineAlpha6_Bin5]
MDIIKNCLRRPIIIYALIILILFSGILALFKIPIQLTPDVRKPLIEISTNWQGGSPSEVEREIVIKQEDVLKSVKGVERIRSNSYDKKSEIKLEFNSTKNFQTALLMVSNALDRVRGMPEEIMKPTIETSGSEDAPIAWIMLRPIKKINKSMSEFGDLADNLVKTEFEKIPGISRSNIFGGSKTEMQVIVDPQRLSLYKLTIPDIANSLISSNVSLTAGDVDEGKRKYLIRAEGQLDNPEKIKKVVIKVNKDEQTQFSSKIFLEDVAEVKYGIKEPSAYIRSLGKEVIALNLVRDVGVNVLETMEQVKKTIKRLNPILNKEGLELKQVYDETVYINSSIDLVQQNIILGGLLAALVLLLFLNSARATLVIATTIPLTIIGTFVAMAILGKSLNVISLAGLAFAVGMVIDAAIVVLENIFRHKEMGKNDYEASLIGTKEVWQAVFLSALTTVLVFIPLLIVQVEAGQLFRDISVAICVAISLSLVLATTLIPVISSKLQLLQTDNKKKIWKFNNPKILEKLALNFLYRFYKYLAWILPSKKRASVTISTIILISIIGIFFLKPKLEYLPEGNKNLVFGILIPPPGYNLDTTSEIAKNIENQIKPYFILEEGGDSTAIDYPRISNFFYVSTSTRIFIGASTEDPNNVKKIIPLMEKLAFQESGTLGFINQPSIFGRTGGGSRQIDVNFSGNNLNDILDVTKKAFFITNQVFPKKLGNTQIRPKPGLELGTPELRFIPDMEKLSENGITVREFANTMDAFNDGLWIDEIVAEGKNMDLRIIGKKNEEINFTQQIANIPIVSKSGITIPLSSVSKNEITSSAVSIRHINFKRTVTLEIRPPSQIPLEVAINILNESVVKGLSDEAFKKGIIINLSGTADKLSQTLDSMSLSIAIALILVFLSLAILLQSFILSLVIMIAVPLATVGGFIGLKILNLFTYQALDMLTLLGFLILIGIVVNNSILLVLKTVDLIKEKKLSKIDAIFESAKTRVRPIFMSTLTSIFGMFPLVLFPGAGSELYKGLGSVVIGGLFLSAILILIIVPALLTLTINENKIIKDSYK